MSVIPAAATVSLLFVLIREFIEEDWIAVMASFVFGLSFTFWRSAETVEVYTFNALWIIVFLLYAVKSLKNSSQNYIVFAGIILGLSLWVHIQNIMLIPAYLVLLYLLRSDRKKAALSFAAFVFIFAIMFVVNSFQNFEMIYIFASKKGAWVQDTFNQGFMDLVKNIVKAAAFLIYNFSVFILFSFGGVIYLYKKFRKESFFLFTASIFTLGFATFYAVSDNYVFFIPFYIIFTLIIASGIKKLSEKYALRKLRFAPVFIPLFYICSLYIVSSTPQGQKFHQEKLYKDGLTYYMLPWLHNNIGCIEFTLRDGQTTDHIIVLKESSREFIELRKKYQSMEEISKL